jgi:putative addiction module component (TIGR02574 family)
METVEEIFRAALELPAKERGKLASHLLESLAPPDKYETEKAWKEEIERRMREIDEGTVELIDGEEVMRKLRSRFKTPKKDS